MRRVLAVLVGVAVAVAVTGSLVWWASPRPRLVLPMPGPGRGWITVNFVVPESTPPHPRWLVAQELADGMRLWVFDREAGVLRGPWTPPVGDFQVRQDPAGNLLLSDTPDCPPLATDPPAVPRFRIDPVTGECNPFLPPGPADAGESVRVGADDATGELLTSADQSPGGWWDIVRKWAGRPPVPPRHALVWHDWQTDMTREIPVGRGEVWSVACQPETVCVILGHEWKTTLEVWDAPPPRNPWPWATLAGLLAGGLAAWLAKKRRRPQAPDGNSRALGWPPGAGRMGVP